VREAAADAAFLDRALALRAGARILDLGCGFGRHSVPLATRGYRVTGIDFSEPMLTLARRLAERAGAKVDWQRRDMRDLRGLGPFDACVCLYTVLGYFEDEENARVVRGVHDVLRPGGRLVLDLTNPLALMPHWPGLSWRENASGIVRETSEYDPLTARLTSRRTIFGKDGRSRELPATVVRMYAPNETARLLEDAGFEVEQVYGALRDKPFRWNRSPQQVWVAGRR
jgi:2-polyprenyl-3-methyl-5-hydroxy-6-metoxy-1,4-benzoquinol methylase